jgi:hypothetical protein
MIDTLHGEDGMDFRVRRMEIIQQTPILKPKVEKGPIV